MIDLDDALLYLTSQCLHNKEALPEEQMQRLSECLRTILVSLAARTPEHSIPILSRGLIDKEFITQLQCRETGEIELAVLCRSKNGDFHTLVAGLFPLEPSKILARAVLDNAPSQEDNKEIH